jgi:hypothetical protein
LDGMPEVFGVGQAFAAGEESGSDVFEGLEEIAGDRAVRGHGGSGIWCEVRGTTRNEERGTRCEVSGARCEVRGARCEVCGVWCELRGVRREMSGVRFGSGAVRDVRAWVRAGGSEDADACGSEDAGRVWERGVGDSGCVWGGLGGRFWGRGEGLPQGG